MDLVNPSKEYHTSNNIRHSCQYHIIFCPKYRRRVLIDGVEQSLKEIILSKQEEFDYKVINVEIMSDHVHLTLEISPEQAPGAIISKIKSVSSHVLREQYPELKSRLPTLWTRSYFISSIGTVSLQELENYIEDQKNH